MTTHKKIKVDLVQTSDDAGVNAIFEKISAATGIGNIHRVLANAPKVFPNYIGYVHSMRQNTELDPAERELALLCVLKLCGAEYEFIAHRRLALTLGLTEAQIENTGNPAAPGLYSERQQALLRFALRLASGAQAAGTGDVNAIKEHLSDRQIIELGLTLAFYFGMSHFTDLIDIPAETSMPTPKKTE